MMSETADELRGWIQPCVEPVNVSDCRRELEALGIDVGRWDEDRREFERCVISLTSLNKLDPLWGRYIWGLEP